MMEFKNILQFIEKFKMNRRGSAVESQIHVNPHRPKTPSRIPSISVASEYETLSNGRTSETLLTSRDPITYGAIPDRPVNETSTTPLSSSHSFEDDDDDDKTPFFSSSNLRKLGKIGAKEMLNHLKVFILFVITVTAAVFVIMHQEEESVTKWNMTSVQYNTTKTILIPEKDQDSLSQLILKGPFDDNISSTGNILIVLLQSNIVATLHINQSMLASQSSKEISTNTSTLKKPESIKSVTLNLTIAWQVIGAPLSPEVCYPLDFSYKFSHSAKAKEIWALVVLIFVYGLIIFDLVHRTLAAIIGSLIAIAVMSAFSMRPTLETIMSWLDVETLSLLFGMMIIVAIFSETGFFDFCALQAYKLAKGKVWPLITLLCAFSAIVSAFLDNVTTILLLTPVTIRLCEVLNLDPKKILIAEVLFSNIGGTATAIGDPPNVMIVSHKDIRNAGISFANFSGYMALGILFVALAAYGLLRFIYRNMADLENKDPIEISELRHEIEMWRRAAMRIVAVSREEKVMQAMFLQRVAELENQLVKAMYKMQRRKQKNFKEMLTDLETKYRITNIPLLLKSCAVLLMVIILFFTYSFVHQMHVGLGWIAIIGAVLLMVLADMHELETILHRVEWSTLIFFAALFSLMEALNELGLIKWIGDGVSQLINDAEEEHRLLVAVVMIIWVSSLASSFIDNIPFTSAMIPIIVQLNTEANLPIFPLVLALAFGACLGGNGTIIGASANVVSAGIAEQHGYGFTFWDFFKVGFPTMLVTTLVAMVYLIIGINVGLQKQLVHKS
ncbi:P protein-like isoform X2 [Dreissena polymorpha]|uniref:P protein-like isoform X2 n=1 Tax=Dreissena polymorpha TaxID=45954 RepID=UPI0022646CED|nr:P protein-like isoform X2 [Dreissena polymorpha]